LADHRTNLPAARTRLIGREAELATIRDLLLHEDGRLVTLTGAGGIGKTSLAFDVGRLLLAEMPDGIWAVDLATAADPEEIALRCCGALGVVEQPAGPEDVLVTYLEPRQALLILDGCERVAPATAALVDRLLDRCPDLRILVASQARLGVRGEVVVAVPPLALPDPETRDRDAILAAPAVRLFLERARATRPQLGRVPPDLEAIVAICRRLDGVPLAIELAAAQTTVLTPAQIVRRLPRLEGMARAIDASLKLLPDDASRLFRRLAVFAGGWTLEAAEAVCSLGEDGASVQGSLAALVEASLVVRDAPDAGGRFRMLAPIADEAARRLLASDEQDLVSLAHAQHFVALLRAGPAEWDPERGLSATIEPEYENCLAALRFLERRGADALLVGFVMAMVDYWGERGLLHDAHRWLRSAHDRLRGVPSRESGYLLGALAHFERLLGDLDRADEHAVEAEAIFRDEGEARGLLAAIGVRGDIAADRGRYDVALEHYERIRSLIDAEVWPLMRGVWHANVGDIHYRVGDVARARLELEQARRYLQRRRSWYLGRVLLVLAEIDRERGELDDATRRAREALRVGRSVGARLIAIGAIEEFARLALARGDHARATVLYAAATALLDAVGRRPSGRERRVVARDVRGLRHALGPAQFERAWRAGQRLSLDQAADVAAGAPGPWLDLAYRPDADPTEAGSDEGPPIPLTPRELEVAHLVAEGLTNRQIAERLAIAPGTTRIHVERILRKLGLTSRVQVATWVVRSRPASGAGTAAIDGVNTVA
jgi:non-specific serine/threonine protein kinase